MNITIFFKRIVLGVEEWFQHFLNHPPSKNLSHEEPEYPHNKFYMATHYFLLVSDIMGGSSLPCPASIRKDRTKLEFRGIYPGQQ
ncbi:MAG: hypothetical protein ACXVKT_00300 [Flavisolibacter sp.]